MGTTVGLAGLAAFCLRRSEDVRRIIRNVIVGNDNDQDPAVNDINPGSLLVDITCKTRESLLTLGRRYSDGSLTTDIEKGLKSIGYEKAITVTAEKDGRSFALDKVHQALLQDQLRQEPVSGQQQEQQGGVYFQMRRKSGHDFPPLPPQQDPVAARDQDQGAADPQIIRTWRNQAQNQAHGDDQLERLPTAVTHGIAGVLTQIPTNTSSMHITFNVQQVYHNYSEKESMPSMKERDVTASFHKHVPTSVKKRLNETLSQDDVWNQVKKMYGIPDETPCPPDVVSSLLSQVEGSIASFISVLLKLKERHRGQQDIPQHLIDEVKGGLRNEMEYKKLRQNKILFAEELHIDIGRILDYFNHYDMVPDEEIALLKNSVKENPRDACRKLFEILIAGSPEKQPIKYLKDILRKCRHWHLADELEVSYQDVEYELQKQRWPSCEEPLAIGMAALPTPATGNGPNAPSEIQNLGPEFLEIYNRALKEGNGPYAPSEIQNLGPEFLEIYNRALKEGKSKVCRIRVMLLGHHRAGKTRLRKALLKQPYDPELDFETNGVEVDPNVSTLSINRCMSWDANDEEDLSRSLIAEAIKESLQADTSSEKDGIPVLTTEYGLCDQAPELESITPRLPTESETSMLTHSADMDPGETGENLDENLDENLSEQASNLESGHEFNIDQTEIPEDAKDMHKAVMKLFEGKGTAERDECKVQLSIWDFGGQHVYYTTHQTFLSQRAIYLLVLDASNELDKEISTYKQSSEGPVLDKTVPQTVKEHSDYWLDSVHSFTTGQTVEESECPPVIIIGTHKDKLTEPKIDAFCKNVRQHLKGKHSHNHHVYNKKYFVVNATDENDPELNALKKCIMDIAREQPYWGEDHPCKWLELESQLHKRSNKKIMAMKLDDVLEMAGKEPISMTDKKEVKACLVFLHALGEVTYFDEKGLEDIVILDPQWLINAFRSIITLPRYEDRSPKTHDFWDKLHEEAILDEKLVNDVWGSKPAVLENKKAILHVMEKFDIISKHPMCSESGSDQYFVPCQARKILEETTYCTQTSLCYESQQKFFPNCLFHRLVAACLHRYKLGNGCLYANCVRLSLDPAGMLVLTLWKRPYSIRLEMKDLNEPHSSKDLYVAARKFIEEQLEKVASLYCPNLRTSCLIYHADCKNWVKLSPDLRNSLWKWPKIGCSSCHQPFSVEHYHIWFEEAEEEKAGISQSKGHLQFDQDTAAPTSACCKSPMSLQLSPQSSRSETTSAPSQRGASLQREVYYHERWNVETPIHTEHEVPGQGYSSTADGQSPWQVPRSIFPHGQGHSSLQSQTYLQMFQNPSHFEFREQKYQPPDELKNYKFISKKLSDELNAAFQQDEVWEAVLGYPRYPESTVPSAEDLFRLDVPSRFDIVFCKVNCSLKHLLKLVMFLSQEGHVSSAVVVEMKICRNREAEFSCLRQNFSFVKGEVDTVRLLDYLYEKKVINENQMDEIKKADTQSRGKASDALFKALLSCDLAKEPLWHFKVVLRKEGQGHIADKLEPEPDF